MRWLLRVALVGLVVGLAIPAAAAPAATTIEKGIPFEATIEACGETITLSGTLLGVFIEQPLGQGGFLLSFHFQPQGVSGTSSSGVPYHANGLTRETTVLIPSGGFTDTFVNRFHIVGTMGAPTYYVKETFHITVLANGDVVAFVDNFSLECVQAKENGPASGLSLPEIRWAAAMQLLALSRPFERVWARIGQ